MEWREYKGSRSVYFGQYRNRMIMIHFHQKAGQIRHWPNKRNRVE